MLISNQPACKTEADDEAHDAKTLEPSAESVLRLTPGYQQPSTTVYGLGKIQEDPTRRA